MFRISSDDIVTKMQICNAQGRTGLIPPTPMSRLAYNTIKGNKPLVPACQTGNQGSFDNNSGNFCDDTTFSEEL